jgi:deferrochelatase/peroxidase EfeB
VTAAEAVGAFRRLRTPDVSAGGVNLVIAFGADAWREVAPWAAPAVGAAAELAAEQPAFTYRGGRDITGFVDGKELEIFRRSVPVGTAEEHGLYFAAFSAQRSR